MKYTQEEKDEILQDMVDSAGAADDRLYKERLCQKCIAALEEKRKEQKENFISWVRFDLDDFCSKCGIEVGEIIRISLNRENPADLFDDENDDEF